jgi:hypothetical protein
MEAVNNSTDYSLESIALNDEADGEAVKILSAQKLEIDSPEVRCMKGDCNGDYTPG